MRSGQRHLIIGPKGSGKSAILRAPFQIESRNPFITASASSLMKPFPTRLFAHQTKPSLASIVPDQDVAPPTFA
jgi:ABC-type cobalamin/Fe3+-siderophores transport system ATPase subunit